MIDRNWVWLSREIIEKAIPWNAGSWFFLTCVLWSHNFVRKDPSSSKLNELSVATKWGKNIDTTNMNKSLKPFNSV